MPSDHHDGSITETDQVVNVCDAPDEPAYHARELQPVDLHDSALVPNRYDRTDVAVAKPPAQLRLLRAISSFATYLPCCLAPPASPDIGFPFAPSMSAASPMTKMFGYPGSDRSGSTSTRPA